MANREKGEVSIDVGGRPYRLALTLDAMVALEEMFSKPNAPMTFQQVVDRSDAGSMTHTRGLLWASLQVNDPPPDLKEVSHLVQQAGGLGAFTIALIKLAKAIAPDPKDLAALGIKANKANPPAAQAGRKTAAGTGGGSTSMPDASA